MIGRSWPELERELVAALQGPAEQYWEQVCAAPSYLRARRVQLPPTPDFAPALAKAVKKGYDDGKEEVLAAVRRTLPGVLRRALAGGMPILAGRQDGAARASDVLVRRLAEIVIDEDMVEQYVARRVPPLRWALEEKARRALAQKVATGANQGLTWLDIRAKLEESYGLTLWHAENIARTELGTMYTNGSLANYLETDLVTRLQYQAVLDTRTTPVCARLNGRVFRAEDVTSRISPPLHYQCRSVLSPVMPWEETGTEDLEEVFADATPDELPLDGFGAADLPVIEQWSLSEIITPDLPRATGETKRALTWLRNRAASGW